MVITYYITVKVIWKNAFTVEIFSDLRFSKQRHEIQSYGGYIVLRNSPTLHRDILPPFWGSIRKTTSKEKAASWVLSVGIHDVTSRKKYSSKLFICRIHFPFSMDCQANSSRCLPPACLLVSCWTYFFDPEYGGGMYLRSVGWHSTDYTALYTRNW
jgi:hypothetical protein